MVMNADGYLSSLGGEEKVLEYVVMLAAGFQGYITNHKVSHRKG